MSLFSRIDRLRGGNGADSPNVRDEEGVFAIPDLSHSAAAPTPDAGAPKANVSEEATSSAPVAFQEAALQKENAPRVEAPPKPEKPLSPLERLARRAAEADAEVKAGAQSQTEPLQLVPSASPSEPESEGALDRPAFERMGAVSSFMASAPEPVETPPQPVNFASLSSPSPDAPTASPTAVTESEASVPAALSPEEPPVAPSPALPVSGGGTAFDRLMTARAATTPAPRSGTSSLAERLAAMRAQAEAHPLTPSAPLAEQPQAIVEPAVPVVEEEMPAPDADATAEEWVLREDDDLEVETHEPVAIEAPPVEAVASEIEEPTENIPLAGENILLARENIFPVTDLAPVVAEIAPLSSPENQAIEVVPPLPWNAPAEPVAPPIAAVAEVAPVAPMPASSALWAQRMAGRDALRDAPLPTAPSLSPLGSAGGSDSTEALDIASGPLARLDGEGAASEGESRNRALYRQKHLIFDAVLGALDARTLQNATRETVKAPLERAVEGAVREFNLSLEGPDRNWMVEEFVREITDLGPLVGLLEDVSVNKVLVVGSTDVAVERLGRIERTGVSFRDDDHLMSVVRRIAELTGGRIDAKVPLLDRPLPDGARIRAKIPPLSPQPTLTVEKSTGNPFLALKRQQAERGRENALPYALLRERIQQRLLREFEGNAAALGNPERLRVQVEEMIGLVIAEERVAVTRAERAALVMDLLNEIVGLGPIEPLLNDPDVDEVMVNGPFQIYVERKGKLEIAPQRFRDNAHVMQVIERIVAPLGRRVDEKSPMVDGRLRDGSRFNAIIPPLALSGPTMTIRKFARDPLTMTDLINFGSLTREAAQFLQAAVEGRLNIVVSGGTGSGKTTTLNVLSSFIPSTERIVTIEDAAELQLRQEHIVRLETRPANIEGSGEISIRDLVRNSLRMRPDRIVVGECRGGEALDMLQAMNTGHDGSLTTAHSNGPRDTIKRLETMVMMSGFDLPVRAIREQISMAVQLVVHQERMRDGKRRITAITELVGMEGEVVTMQDIFRFEQERVDDEGRIIGSLAATGLRPHNYDTIVDNGGHISMDMFQPRTMGGHGADLRSRLSERR